MQRGQVWLKEMFKGSGGVDKQNSEIMRSCSQQLQSSVFKLHKDSKFEKIKVLEMWVMDGYSMVQQSPRAAGISEKHKLSS